MEINNYECSMLIFISPKIEVDIRKECVKMH